MCVPRIQVNLNGHISFETELPVYRSNFVLPFGYKLLAVFLADVDTRLSGNVLYRYAQGHNYSWMFWVLNILEIEYKI